MEIANEKVVQIHYTLTNDAKEVLDTSDGREPLAYLQGRKNIIPGLESALEGKAKGDKLNVSIEPKEAYGEVMAELVQTVPVTQFDSPENVKVGAQFQVQMGQGMGIATIKEVNGDQVTLDMNHPLAGQTLHFAVEVVEVRDATAEELEHGHVHGPGGHQH